MSGINTDAKKPQNSKYQILIKNIIIFGIGLVGTKFVQFILLPYFTNVLTTSEYGIIDLVATFSSFMVPIVTLELSDAVLRFGLSDDVDKRELLENSFIILCGACLLTFAFSPVIILYKTISQWYFYVVFIVITQCFKTNMALFVKADNHVFIYSIDSMLTALLIALLDIYFISVRHFGIKGYFLAEIAGNICSITFLFLTGKIYQYWRIPTKINFILMKSMMKYSIPLMFNAISWWITSFSDRFVLDIFFTTSEVGLYSVAAKIPAIITTFLSIFTQAWIMSAIKEYEHSNDVVFFEKVYNVYTSLLFSTVAVLILIIKPVMYVYVGKEFFISWRYVPVLLLGSAFLGITNYYGAIYAAAKANILEIKSTIICALSNLILNFILIPHFGIMGAVIATALSYMIAVIVRIIDTKKILRINSKSFFLISCFAALLLEIKFVIDEQVFIAFIMAVLIVGFTIGKMVVRKSFK